MNQEVFPEIQAATEAIEARIALTEAEVAQMKEEVRAKKALLRSWRKALATFNPTRSVPSKRVGGTRKLRAIPAERSTDQ